MPQVNKEPKDYFYLNLILNISLVVILATILILKAVRLTYIPENIFAVTSIVAVVPVLINAVKGFLKKELTIDLLAAIALIFALLARQWDSAAFINLMLASARIFDLWTQKRTQNIVKHLLKYRPEKVKVKKGNDYEVVDVDAVKVGDVVVIEAGERIPVDGTVVEGQASINEATLTGESMPKTKKLGDKVYSSTLNESGDIEVKTEKIAGESTLAKIITLVEEASLKKSATIRIVAVFTQWYIIATLFGAGIIYLLTGNTLFVLSILLVVCADDIAVSIPLAFTAAIARAAQHGILIKSSDVLEKLPKIETFITDKTGTLTFGRPKIVDVKTFYNTSQREFLRYLGAAEANSSHPISRSILEYITREGIKIAPPKEFNELPGEGIEANYLEKRVFAGKVEFLQRNGIKVEPAQLKVLKQFEEGGVSITAVGIGSRLLGLIAFEDEVRPSARAMIARTKRMGVKLWVMLTGDNPEVAQKVARLLLIDRVETNLKPKDKIRYIEKIKSEQKGKILAMIGDGVNDAAALAMADVSYAMGAIGSDAAIDAADVALMNDDLARIPDSIDLGHNTRQIVEQNFAIWGATNAIGLALVAFGILHPTGAATYNFLTDFLPIFNALRVGMKFRT